MSLNLAPKSPTAKALRINLDDSRYGTFAEIGAGQEVARFFFLAGKASNTVAKTMSAYDMTFSDEIYGKEESGRYVCKSRLEKMLDKEYNLLIERLKESKAKNHCFFAFANTCTTGDENKSHAWIGIRFQTAPESAFNDIYLHVRMRDKNRLEQQRALGILGVNLINAAFYDIQDCQSFLGGLTDGLKQNQVVINFLGFEGESLKHIDERIVNIELVRQGLADAVVFSPNLKVVDLSETFYNKAVLIQRGTFDPITKSHLDVLQKGKRQFESELSSQKKPASLMSVFEISMNSAEKGKELDPKIYLSRIEAIAATGNYVLISNFLLFYKIKQLLRLFTNQPLAIVLNAIHLKRVFDPQYYIDLDGGLLEGLGKLLDDKVKLLVYPYKTSELSLNTSNFQPDKKFSHIYQHYIENKNIIDISEVE